jgi:hypothetical protein
LLPASFENAETVTVNDTGAAMLHIRPNPKIRWVIVSVEGMTCTKRKHAIESHI